MSSNRIVLVIGFLSVTFSPVLARCQELAKGVQAESTYTRVDRLSALSRAGDGNASLELAHHVFNVAGISTDMADSLGFSKRLDHADSAYWHGTGRATSQEQLVNAVNTLAASLGAPSWVKTDASEVTKLRMHMLTLYPSLIAAHEPPDSNGRYKALSPKMSPTEASLIATTLLYQKIYNMDYQFGPEEKAQLAHLDSAGVASAHLARTQALEALLHGHNRFSSTLDLLSSADRFFSDLGVEPYEEDRSPTRVISSISKAWKGDR